MPLFDIEPANSCVAFLNTRAAATRMAADARAHCEALWSTFQPFADPHFVTDFPAHFHQRWFEMFLTVELLRAGFDVQCPKPGPDIQLVLGGQTVWIEAVCATAGAPGHPDAVPAPELREIGQPLEARPVPTEQITLRLRTVLQAKSIAFDRYASDRLIAPADIRVVAINIAEVPLARLAAPDVVLRALYGVGNLAVRLDRTTGNIIDQYRQQLISVRKRSGAEVGVQPFLDGSMPQVSAVLVSKADAYNLPENIFSDLLLFPNTSAICPYPARIVEQVRELLLVPSDDGWEGKFIGEGFSQDSTAS